MKLVVRIALGLALLLLAAIAFVQLSGRQRAQQEAAQQQATEAYFKELLADESQHKPPNVSDLADPQPADLNWPLQRVGLEAGLEAEGTGLSLADHQGKTIFIDLWATWCKPCIAQMPSIQRLYEQHTGDNYAFLLISPEEKDVVERFLAENEYTFPVYLTGEEHPETFELQPLPFTYVINPAGELVFSKHGGPNRYDAPSFVEFLRSWSGAESRG
ncbi:MAG: TlpA disulfide reductase family protein [Acidobacteriota bacterium]